MMDFSQTEEQKMVVESAAKLARTLREKLRSTEKEGVSQELVQTYRELGFRELDWPEAYGGSKLGLCTKLLAVEELAFGDAAATLALDRVSFVCGPLLQTAKTADKAHALLQKGGEKFSPAFYVDLDGRLTLKDGRLSGKIPYLPVGRCDALFVMQGDRVVCLTSGVQLRATLVGALDAMGGAQAEVDSKPEWTVELGAKEALTVRGLWRAYLAAVLVGVSRACSEYTRQYCMERITFGKKVAHHQAVAFALADMAVAVDAARLLLQQVAAGADAGKDASLELQHAFLQACECALSVTPGGVQFLASAGYVRDHPVEKWMREARALSLLAGGADGAQEDANRALALLLEAA